MTLNVSFKSQLKEDLILLRTVYTFTLSNICAICTILFLINLNFVHLIYIFCHAIIQIVSPLNFQNDFLKMDIVIMNYKDFIEGY